MPVGMHKELVDGVKIDMVKSPEQVEYDKAKEMLKKAEDCINKISDIENRIIDEEYEKNTTNIQDGVTTLPVMDKGILIQATEEKVEEFVFAVGKQCSIFGVRYTVDRMYPLTVRLKKNNSKDKHVQKLEKGHTVKIYNKSYKVFKVETGFITLKVG